jgi:hypothetical protein
MATNFKIIHAREFIRAMPEGRLDFEAYKKLLADLASAASTLSDSHVILDLRLAPVELPFADLELLANEYCSYRGVFPHKLAVVCLPERYDRASFFALCAKNRGLYTKVFTSYEEAMEWLIEEWS